MTDRTFACHRIVGTTRCGFTGGNDDAGEHMRETGHRRCTCCQAFLEDSDATGMACTRCVTNVRADLAEIVEAVALAPEVIEAGGYRGRLAEDLLTMVADGNDNALRPYVSKRPEHKPELDVPHGQLVGNDTCWLPYVEHRHAENGTEHYADHWRSDPDVALPILESLERRWRQEFGHGPAVSVATISTCASYLVEWVTLAGRTWQGFDDDAAEIRDLAKQLRNRTGTANHPARGTKCPDCDVSLIQPYRPLIAPVQRRRKGTASEGRDDVWECPRCHETWTHAEYGLLLRQKAADAQGWVLVSLAAEVTRRHRRVVWQWVTRKQVRVSTDAKGRVLVWMPDVREVHENVAATRRRSISHADEQIA